MPVEKVTRNRKNENKRKAALDASWVRRRADVAAKIERSALTLFLKHGIERVTVEDIAAAAQISRRNFYRYFESPAQVLSTVLCRSMDRWAQIVRSRPMNESLVDSFRVADQVTLSVPENSEPIAMALGVMRRSPEAWRRIMGPMQAHTTQTYQEIIAERMNAAGKSSRSAGAIAAGLTAIMIHLAEQSASEGRMLESAEVEQALVAFQKLIALPL